VGEVTPVHAGSFVAAAAAARLPFAFLAPAERLQDLCDTPMYPPRLSS
jgi:hypothetical protein